MAASAYARRCAIPGWLTPNDAYRERAVALAWRAVELAPNDAQVLWMAASRIWNMADAIEPARELFDAPRLRSIRTPRWRWCSAAGSRRCAATRPAGRAMIERATAAQSARPARLVRFRRARVCAVQDQNFAEAVMWADKALAQNRRFAVALRVLIVALVKTARTSARRRPRAGLSGRPESRSQASCRDPVPGRSNVQDLCSNAEGGRRPGLICSSRPARSSASPSSSGCAMASCSASLSSSPSDRLITTQATAVAD